MAENEGKTPTEIAPGTKVYELVEELRRYCKKGWHMDDNKVLEIILNYIKQKGALSDLEKDILSTIDKYIN